MLTALHPAHVVDVLGLVLVLRDMGNGVTRIECASILDRGCGKDCRLPDLVPLSLPLSPRIADFVAVALTSLGGRAETEFTEAKVRPVCEDVTEFYFW